MAILGTVCKDYFKIIYEECFVRGGFVFVSFMVYKTKEDREAEKIRLPQLNIFMENVDNKLKALDKRAGENEEERKLNIYPLAQTALSIKNAMYKYGENPVPEVTFLVSKESLIPLGFDEAWIENPIRVLYSAQVECGEYNGETLSAEFFYNLLKGKIIGEIENV